MSDEMFNLTDERIQKLRQQQIDRNSKLVSNDLKTVKCNICGYESDLEFLNFNSRPNEICPNCSSIKRVRYYYYYLQNYTDFFEKPQKILHTSPEQGAYEKFESLFHENYITSDVYLKKDNIKELIDIQNIPFEDNTFTYIISLHVLEHVPDDTKALEEFYRVLQPGGKVIILIPSLRYLTQTFEDEQINTPELRQRYYKQYDHLRFYSVQGFFDKMEDVGFKVLRNHENIIKEEHPTDIEKYRTGYDPLFVGIKE